MVPIFEYQCDCGYTFDELIKSGQKPKTRVCPSCGSRKFKKKVSKFLRTGQCSSCAVCPGCAEKK